MKIPKQEIDVKNDFVAKVLINREYFKKQYDNKE